jgi:hypothetical protein
MAASISNVSRFEPKPVRIYFEMEPLTVLVFETLRSLAFLTSLLSIKVLTSLRTSILVYKYIKLMSVADAFYTGALLVFRVLELLCAKSPAESCPSIQYAFLVSYIWISDYFTSCLAFFNILMEIFVQIQRMLIVMNRLSAVGLSSRGRLVSIFIFLVAFTIYTPYLFMKRVSVQSVKHGRVKYQLVLTEFGQSELSISIVNVINSARMFLIVVVLFVLNLITLVRFRMFLKRRKLDLKAMNCKFDFNFLNNYS